MDRELFLQYLRDHTLEEGQAYIQEHTAELSDHTTIGEWLADEALQFAEQARIIFSQLGEQYWVGVINNNIGLVYEFVGRCQDAINLHELTLAFFATITDQQETEIQRTRGIIQINLARNVSWLGDIERAYALLQQAQASFVTIGETALANLVEYELAYLDDTQGYYGSALRHYYQARDGMFH